MQPKVGAPQAAEDEALSFEAGWKSRAAKSRGRDLELFADEGDSSPQRGASDRHDPRREPVRYEPPVAPPFAAIALLAALITMAAPLFDSREPLPLPSRPVVQSAENTQQGQVSQKVGETRKSPNESSAGDPFTFALPASAPAATPKAKGQDEDVPSREEPRPVRDPITQPAITPHKVASSTVSTVVNLAPIAEPPLPRTAVAPLESLPVATAGRTNAAPEMPAGVAPVLSVSERSESKGPALSERSESKESVDEAASVREVLNKYADAYTALDAYAVRDVWPTVNESALGRAFEGLVSQTVRLQGCKISVTGIRAQAVCGGTASWLPRIGGGKAREARRTWTFALAQRDRQWAIVTAEMR
jgi:hypothetical protein